MDIEYEIKWHEKYLKQLHQHKKNPSIYHRKLTSHKINQDRLRHFKEHVIDAIPFHRSLIEKQKKRLETIKMLMPMNKFKKLVKVSMKYGGTPEYLVYDKLLKNSFFVSEHLSDDRIKWMVKAKKLTEVIVLES